MKDMPNPEKRYAKGARRREELLNAALEVLAEQGIAGLTHRAVTERAGCPFTSVSYFFGTIDQLAVEAIQLIAENLNTHLEALAQRFEGGEASPADVAAEFSKLLTTYSPALELARYEVLLHAVRNPSQTNALAGIVRSMEHVAEVALRAAGARRPEAGARAFAALAEGLNLYHLVGLRADDVEAANAAFRALFIAFAMDDQEHAAWEENLKVTPSDNCSG
ncbi:TetR family transcriptional regulator [Streptomyces sp. NBC_00513]|uniref:TetR/AcrR family transcriptional regulator n=1 Tax=unclassified Streptomyces TaxID=2593676 RepID=UPI0022586C92|nr:TetR family transcriptional regulator [Streptomyces sp. NBC_00424]MCX5071187.1 TetR family transcriptional regulator [Streptomyces sp. NBC_00424]WUD45397.1 TetR family transcriptional regulator [Streptomyces sp. NBC_00513]